MVFRVLPIVLCLAFFAACRSTTETNQNTQPAAAASPAATPQAPPSPTPARPNLQTEILDDRGKETAHAIGKFDFKNYTFELPRGWHNPDGSAEITLTNGKVAPVAKTFSDDMTDEEKLEARAQRRIGMSYVTTKYMDVTGDGEDEAIVILKVETGGSAIPQLAYVFTWKNGAPELLWPFRTGDRADGGLKDIRSENGLLTVELYGQDRFLLGQTETGKITGDEEQLCCPTFFTRTQYKWNGNAFLMQGKRLTYSLADPSAAPLVNWGDIVNKPAPNKR
jgi:hypothetical protein